MEWYHWILGGIATGATTLVTVLLPGWIKYKQGLSEVKKKEREDIMDEVKKVVGLQAEEFDKNLARYAKIVETQTKEIEEYKKEIIESRKEVREINLLYNNSLRATAERDVKIIALEAQIQQLNNRLTLGGCPALTCPHAPEVKLNLEKAGVFSHGSTS